MSKNSKLGYLALAVTFIVVSVIAFVVPTEKNSVFWIAYCFTVIAFVLQIIVWNVAFGKTETMKSKFLGLPLIQVGVTYLIIQIIAFAIMAYFAGHIQPWIPVVVCLPLLGFTAIEIIGAEVGRNEINRVEEHVGSKVFSIKSMQVDVGQLANIEKDEKTKDALHKLAEAIRYSDPMSADELEAIEQQISDKIEEMKQTDNKAMLIQELQELIAERNAKCKLLK